MAHPVPSYIFWLIPCTFHGTSFNGLACTKLNLTVLMEHPVPMYKAPDNHTISYRSCLITMYLPTHAPNPSVSCNLSGACFFKDHPVPAPYKVPVLLDSPVFYTLQGTCFIGFPCILHPTRYLF